MINATTLIGALALALQGASAEQTAPTREALERQVVSAISGTPGLLVKPLNMPAASVASAEVSKCHTRFRAGGALYDFDWSTPTSGPVRSRATSFSGFINSRLASILIPDQASLVDQKKFEALFSAINAYWQHCNPGATMDDGW